MILSFLALMLVFAQARPEFEVASIRPSGAPRLDVNVGLTINGAQARFAFLSLKDYIGMAYRVKPHQVVGPDWLASERFDIAAKLPEGGSEEQVPEMLQALLADRFQMKARLEKKEFPTYALVIGKGGLKMKESAAAETDANTGDKAVTIAATGNSGGAAVNLGNGSSFAFGNNRVEGKRLTMESLAEMLSRFADRTVIDMTGLKGRYDMTLEVNPEDYRAMMIRSAMSQGIVLPPQVLRALESGSNASLSDALQKVGLELQSQRSPMDIVVIDTMSKAPTEN